MVTNGLKNNDAELERKQKSSSGSSYIRNVGEHGDSTVIFAIKDELGVLADILKLFQDHGINLKHIESRSSKKLPGHYEFALMFDGHHDASKLIEQLKKETAYLEVISREKENQSSTTVPWFPLRVRDLDKFAEHILMYGSELEADHPGFTDQKYRKRREEFANIAKHYKHGQPIPRVEYTEQEIETWRAIYRKVVPLYKQHACKEYNHIFPLMEENCGYREDNIPQLEDVSRFLKDSSGFTLRPVAGLLSSRDFLAENWTCLVGRA